MCLHCTVISGLQHKGALSLGILGVFPVGKAEGKPPSMGEASPLEIRRSWSSAQTDSQPCMRSVHVKITRVHGEGNACE